ncbi:MAG: YeeE/YedE thiosulfate transporter family protein [Kiritimatiellae bacterium]|nr:YeeE/YedE thiosulfate transporter family protein [Kiritimatiellia bacterium]
MHTDSKSAQAAGAADTAPKPFLSPYLAGFGLGVALLCSYAIIGAGLGASGGMARVAAWIEHALLPRHVEGCAYFGPWFQSGASHVLRYYLVAMCIGVLLGAYFSARGARRIRSQIERGPTASARLRLLLALLGGVIAGYASRLARGCTAGQALSGMALLLSGSAVFLVCVFAGGFAATWFVRRQWS